MAIKGPQRPIFDTVEELDEWYTRQRAYMLGLPVTLISRNIPWGYKRVSKGSKELVADDFMFELLIEAKQCWDTERYEMSELANWLTEVSGVRITDMGLSKLLKVRRPDDRAGLPIKEREKL